jgi:hypothetical protein
VIDCVADDGTACEDLSPPSGQCSIDEITTLRFRVGAGTCDESRTTQDDNFVCEESGGALPVEGLVRVSCSDESDGSVIVTKDVLIGGFIDVENMIAGELLPEVLVCTVSVINGNEFQSLTINTSGNVDLFLKDRYGALELEACEVNDQTQDCITQVIYSYILSNTGEIDMDITLLERTRNNITSNLLGSIPDPELSPGDTTTVIEFEQLDLCVDGAYVTRVRVEADPPDGFPCFDEDTFEFIIDNQCRVDADISCTSEDGVDCMDLQQQDTVCYGGADLTTVRLLYRDSTCLESTDTQGDASSCQESADGLAGLETVVVTCTSPSGAVVPSTPVTVGPGDSFSLNDPAGLPNVLTCIISDINGVVRQTIVFDASGEEELNLKDKFGGLELESCTDTSGKELDCLTEVLYVYDISNVGTNDMEVTLFEIIRDNMSTSLLGLLENTTLAPGDSSSVNATETIDLCVGMVYTTETKVEANPPGGKTCEAEALYTFNIDGVCLVEVSSFEWF